MLGSLRNALITACIFGSSLSWSAPAHANDGEAHWIWSPAQTKNEIPVGECYFRKSFDLAGAAEGAEVQITADNEFELTVNGQPVATGVDWRKLQVHDIAKLLRKGRNTVAVRVLNKEVGAAGLAARVIIKQAGGTYEGFSTDETWRTSVRQFQGWTMPQFNDNDWVAAASYGLLGEALPWGNEIVIDGVGARFIISSDFAVERTMRDSEVGSLIAMTFDAKGNIIASQEGGHLLLLTDSDDNGIHDKVTTYCDKITNAQGLLALGTRLFVVGDGPEGMALYRLRDSDRNNEADEITKLIAFRGSKGEHGAHAVRLGPDGYLYVVVGNFTRADGTPTVRSPYRNWYEGDLILPKFEDPGGHAVGIPAPGGTIFRTDANGSFVEMVAGGLRNAYDLAFSPDGELFTYDADMEWDRGAPWYRPTRVNHIIDGAELGWRSGWSKWPEYYLDSLPAAVDVGAGSPTGIEFYDHYAFPAKYHGALFGCDWATGRIHAFTFERVGSSYIGRNEVFLEGRPLNATDIAVGPDGNLYFCTGGRGTDGGVYRIRYTGDIPPELGDMGEGIERALRQPQIEADWARAKVAAVKQALGARWEPELHAVATDAQRPARERTRALDLLVFFGPRPGHALLKTLAADADPAVRAKAARLMFTSDDPATREALVKLLSDEDAMVRRCACESLARRGPLPPAEAVLPLLADEHRFTGFAARRLLEQIPVDTWSQAVLDESRPLVFCRGAISLLAIAQNAQTSHAVLERCQTMLQSVTDMDERLHLLRVAELALYHGKLTAADVPSLAPQLLAMYPTDDELGNRELVRLLAFLQAPGAADKFAAELAKAETPLQEKLHIAAHASRLEAGWTAPAKMTLLQFYEEARGIKAGYSVDKYVEEFTREFLKKLNLEERRHLLAGGEKWPASALSTLASLPADPGAEILATVRELDKKVGPQCATSDLYRRLRVGILAVLGAADEPASQEHLRNIYRDEPDYRDPVAMSLAQHPDGENWRYLVDALRTAEGAAAQEILVALAKVNQRPSEEEAYRNVILLGLKLGENGGAAAVNLLNHWNGGAAPNSRDQTWSPENDRAAGNSLRGSIHAGASDLAAWQRWFAEKYPNSPPAELPADAGRDKWSYDELLTFISSDAGKGGNAARGAEVFVRAQCAACHRVGSRGETVGPDLSAVARRFQRKEILESIVYPSHVISDQYATRIVMAGGKSYAGLVTEHARGVTILTSTGQKVELSSDEIEDIQPSSTSAMPAGLLNTLSLEQVADLFAYLSGESANVAQRPAATR
ncbi:MAG TPA: HEAT repeat domain-containing protein [Lacipirellula sp.]